MGYSGMKMPKQRFLLTVAGLFFAVAASVAAIGYFEKVSAPSEELPVYGAAPSFVLTEKSGSSFDSASLKGKVWIADFFFTSCPGICPMMTTEMKKLSEALKDVRFVSISSDPAVDTPQVLTAYVETRGLDASGWFFLTGKKEDINAAAKGFLLGPLDEPMMHSNRFMLVGRDGAVRGYYDSTDKEAMARLLRHARSLSKS